LESQSEREIDSRAPESGDHTGIPGAHRTLIFVGKGGGHALELVYYIYPDSPSGHLNRNQLGAAHVCFNVENIEELYQDLTNNGVKFVTPPIMTDTETGGRHGISYCQDPEGNWLEFIQAD
jgi:catechol 2,3-dioxygenase-like lactoylglutathione lyase family enzyme